MSARISDDSGDEGGINEINITPFVDIMLVLLIIFMLATPSMVARGLKVELPMALTTEDLSHVTLRLLVDADGKLLLDGKPVSAVEVGRAVEELKKARTSIDAVVFGDQRSSFGNVMAVVDQLKAFGIEKVGFAANQGAKPKS